MKNSLGRCVYGLAAIGFGICALVWHDVSSVQQVKALGDAAHREVLTSIVAVVEILGGAALQFRRTARLGAAVLGVVYFMFALLGVPSIIAHPLVYNGYGNFFEQFSLASAALILYARSRPMPSAQSARLAAFGYYSFGICVLSFALEQLFYLAATAALVPKWIPPGQMFWALTTTVAFALAAIALLTGFVARLASKMTTAMIVGFAFLIWLPALFADPHNVVNWSEGVETVAIAASAWIVADFAGRGPSTGAHSLKAWVETRFNGR